MKAAPIVNRSSRFYSTAEGSLVPEGLVSAAPPLEVGAFRVYSEFRRITILALGSRGDIQPFAPLVKALQQAGHRVRIATLEAFAWLITNAGLGFYAIQGDAQALLNAAAQGGGLTGQFSPLQVIRALRCAGRG